MNLFLKTKNPFLKIDLICTSRFFFCVTLNEFMQASRDKTCH